MTEHVFFHVLSPIVSACFNNMSSWRDLFSEAARVLIPFKNFVGKKQILPIQLE